MRKCFRQTSLALTGLVCSMSALVAEDTPFKGLHAGLDFGYGSYTSTWSDLDYDWNGGTLQFKDDEGYQYGLNVGYDHQAGSLVIGAELGIERPEYFGVPYYSDDVYITNEAKRLYTLRFRGGVTKGSTLFYAVAGLAKGEFTHSWAEKNDSSDTWHSFRTESMGYIVGLGIEHIVADHISVRGELVNYRFEGRQKDNLDEYTMEVTDEITAFRIGVGYRF